ncbi:MAG: PD-(D/E)XK nuclease family protein [Patescibacteria group bacterium]|nr:PD-(D/E)XK nuclease family protein [Patescibacteria group bacterium]
MSTLSRTKLDLFIQCPRCFYLDQKLKIKRPSFPAFTLNSAVDALLKKEFDKYRAAPDKKHTPHPLLKKYKLDAIPIPHKDLSDWRSNFKGIRYHHPKTGLTIFGAIDDLWQNKKGEFIIVDYKATSKKGEILKLDDTRWHNAYKRQMEIYQWLFRMNGFKVSDTGYILYCNGRRSEPAFGGRLEFDLTLIPYKGSTGWVEGAVVGAWECLKKRKAPKAAEDCEYCGYVKRASQ